MSSDTMMIFFSDTKAPAFNPSLHGSKRSRAVLVFSFTFESDARRRLIRET